MLKFYLTTVIIYMIIINCTTEIFKEAIKKKTGKTDGKKASLFKRLNTLFVLAAVPVIRLIVVIVLIYVATCKQEDFDNLMKKTNT